jgi:phosphoglycolate phosphatase
MLKQPPLLLVFDWDGTLVDSTRAIARAIQRAAADLHLEVPDDRRASHVIGLGLSDALRLAVPGLTRQRLPEYVERYRHHYLAAGTEPGAFEGIGEMLDELQTFGVQLAVATGKSRIGLERSLEQTGWRGRFVATRCADEGEPKPHPWMLNDLLEELELKPEQAMMIGDTTHDLQMAQAAGCPAIAVSYGAHPRETLETCAPLALVDHVPALRSALLSCLRAA